MEVSSCVCCFAPEERIAVTRRTEAGWSPDLAWKFKRREIPLKIQILWDVTLCLVSGYQH